MRDLSARTGLHVQQGSFLRRSAATIQLAALYGAFAVIAAILLGSASVHPF